MAVLVFLALLLQAENRSDTNFVTKSGYIVLYPTRFYTEQQPRYSNLRWYAIQIIMTY